MTTTVKNCAITSLLLQLDKKDLSLWMQDIITQEIAIQCRKITRDPRQVGILLRHENNKISYRGDELSDYLMSNSVTVEEILNTFFVSSVKAENGRRILHHYVTVSEMMLMLGTFLEFMELRDRNQSAFKSSLSFAKIEGLFHSKKTEKKLEWENVLERELVREEVTMNYLQNQASSIMKSILLNLGLTIKETSKRQLKRICHASKELCSYSPEWISYFENRAKYGPSAVGDLKIFEQFEKEASDPLIFEKLDEKEKQYRI